MPVELKEPEYLIPIPGIRLSAIDAGIYRSQRDDLVLIELASGSSVASVFTQNAFCAAPVELARSHLAQTRPRYLLINAGNANAATGAKGLLDAEQCCQSLSDEAGCLNEEVLPFSTGVIGEYLPVDSMKAVFPALLSNLEDSNWLQAAKAIMTTDIVAKGVSKQISLPDGKVSITGIAKGSGMIRPDMATMLAFVATDLQVESALLQKMLAKAVEKSFNRICVDGDTSTNDACVLIASGASKIVLDEGDQKQISAIQNELDAVMVSLAQSIVRDGEGASKFVTIKVTGGTSKQLCLDIAYDIGTSPLVKTALFASDPNWGRIIAAVGRSRIAEINTDSISLYLNDLCIFDKGKKAKTYAEEDGVAAMQNNEINITVDLGEGSCEETVWTCDLSHEYIRINAEYRS